MKITAAIMTAMTTVAVVSRSDDISAAGKKIFCRVRGYAVAVGGSGGTEADTRKPDENNGSNNDGNDDNDGNDINE